MFDELVKFRKEKSDSLSHTFFLQISLLSSMHADILINTSIVTCNLIWILLISYLFWLKTLKNCVCNMHIYGCILLSCIHMQQLQVFQITCIYNDLKNILQIDAIFWKFPQTLTFFKLSYWTKKWAHYSRYNFKNPLLGFACESSFSNKQFYGSIDEIR
jgi:hypothetical protein